MITIATETAISIDLSTSLAAVVTLVTVIVIGLATLARPSPASVAWGVAFGLGMLGTYVWVAALQLEARPLQAVASGLMLCFEPTVWLGLRMHFGKRPIWWPVIAFMVIAPSLLGVTAGSAVFQTSFRIVFLMGGVFAAMIALELFRSKGPHRDITLPLALVSCALTVVAVVGAVAALFGGGVDVDTQLDLLRDVNGIGTLLTSVCGAFTLVLLVRADGLAKSTAPDDCIRARRRLGKAQAQGDQAWSILDIHLDDPADLREASTGAGYGVLVDRFHDDIMDALPASADADRVADDRSIVIIRGSEEAVQHHVRTLLKKISTVGDDGSLASMRLSASVGWAGVSIVGYDYDDLVAAAAQAALRAREQGGDRWERVTAMSA